MVPLQNPTAPAAAAAESRCGCIQGLGISDFPIGMGLYWEFPEMPENPGNPCGFPQKHPGNLWDPRNVRPFAEDFRVFAENPRALTETPIKNPSIHFDSHALANVS